MLKVPTTNPNVTVTLNIGLNGSIAWGKYKHENYEHSPVTNLVDILDTPHRVARILERLQQIAYNPSIAAHMRQSYGYAHVDADLPEIKFRVAQSSTEATLVVQFEANAREIIGQVFALAEWLKQDCIAVWIHNPNGGGQGQLIGRYNYVWAGGYFNPEYFIHLDV